MPSQELIEARKDYEAQRQHLRENDAASWPESANVEKRRAERVELVGRLCAAYVAFGGHIGEAPIDKAIETADKILDRLGKD